MKKIVILTMAMGLFFMLKAGIAKSGSDKDSYIPILMYHNITPKPELSKIGYSITPERFESHMEKLKAEGYNTLSLEDLDEFLQKKRPLPKKPILITFDDGKRNNYEYMYPIMKRLSLKGNIFLIGHMLDRDLDEDYMGWPEIEEMKESGLISFGSHTYDLHHKIKGKALIYVREENEQESEYESRIKSDLEHSKRLIEEKLGLELTSIAYPYGGCDKIIDRLAKEVGYRESYTTRLGVQKLGDSGYLLKRINVDGVCSSKRLIAEIRLLTLLENIKAKFTNR